MCATPETEWSSSLPFDHTPVARLVIRLGIPAMLAQFGGEARFQQVMTASTAAAVCALVLGIALYMVLSAGRKRKQL